MFIIIPKIIEKQNIISIIKGELGDCNIYNIKCTLLVFFILRCSACINDRF